LNIFSGRIETTTLGSFYQLVGCSTAKNIGYSTTSKNKSVRSI